LEDVLHEQGYFTRGEIPMGKSGAIEGTAEFRNFLDGFRDFKRGGNLVLMLAGGILTPIGVIVLIYQLATLVELKSNISYLLNQLIGSRFYLLFGGLIILILGAVLISVGREKIMRTWIRIELLGESYKAMAGKLSTASEAEKRILARGVVSDIRVTLGAGVGKPKEIELGRFLTKPKDIETLKEDIEKIANRIDSLIPELKLPAVE
jgi:hypothetical protein